MVDVTPFLPGLSPVQGKAVVARFDGGRLSSEGGLLALREIESRLGLADRLAACMKDPRAPERVVHRLAEIIRFRMLMIAAGYEDGNDADSLRADPMFKLALDRLPSDEELCSKSTTLSTACTAASNYACSTPFMTITASSRSSCLMARGVSSPRCCARASGPAATRSAPSCAASSAPSAPSGRGSRSCCAPILTTPARRSSTGAERTGSIGCWG